MQLLAFAVFVAFGLALFWSAVRHREKGWLIGAFLALLLLLPALAIAVGFCFEVWKFLQSQ
jgi:ABC-type Fe3+ transport system permease subunit